MPWAKLNVFQRLVRRWDELHPYNAAQIMHIAGEPDVGRLGETWRQTICDSGLGAVRCDGNRYRFESSNGQVTPLELSCGSPSTRSLPDLITEHLNRPFEVDRERDATAMPLRPLVAPAYDGGRAAGYYLGIVYHHWVADSASIRNLMREWFSRAYDPGASPRPLTACRGGGYWRHFGPSAGNWSVGDGLLASLRFSSRLRRSRRIEREDFGDPRTHFTLHHLPDGMIDPLRHAARRLGVTISDVFLAAVAEVCDRLGPTRRNNRRPDLALGTIVDLRARRGAAGRRGRSDDDLSDVFGLFLGFTSVVCRPRQLRDWDRLLAHVAAQNRLHKRSGAPEASMIRMLAGLVAHRLLSPENVRHFYRKRLPLAGGLSNVNLTGTWVERYHPSPVLDYIRVSPCGPMMPLVFTPTTLGSRLNFGLTCRRVVSDERAQQMGEMFKSRLQSFITD